MDELTRKFAPYDVSLFMMLDGFDESCFGYYAKQHSHKLRLFERQGFWTRNSYSGAFSRLFAGRKEQSTNCAAPTWHQVIDWFETRHKIFMIPSHVNGMYSYQVVNMNGRPELKDSNLFTTPYGDKFDVIKLAILKVILLIDYDRKHPFGSDEDYDDATAAMASPL